MAEVSEKELALTYFEKAYKAQQEDRLSEAIELYQKSIEIYPTAEAHTFLGWAYSYQDRIDEAISECYRAIEIDSNYGNPYNDIGAYLIKKGDYLNAISWLKKAMIAPRYECYFYPHYNLGRIYEWQGRLIEALAEYSRAFELNGNYELALRSMRRLQGILN